MTDAAHDFGHALAAFSAAVARSHLSESRAELDDAALFAAKAHADVGQLEKYTGRAYAFHFVRVALVLLHLGRPLIEVMAALLHDVIEDTGVTRDALAARFGEAVALTVAEVSNVSRPEDGNRAARKAIDRAHVAAAGEAGSNVKLADVYVNAEHLHELDPSFARVWLPEKRDLLAAMRKGLPELRAVAEKAVRSGLKALAISEGA